MPKSHGYGKMEGSCYNTNKTPKTELNVYQRGFENSTGGGKKKPSISASDTSEQPVSSKMVI